MEELNTETTFEAFREQWLADVVEGNPSTVELGHRFARKLVKDWLDSDDASDDLVYCDGSGDGGIDIAYLDRGETHEGSDEGSVEGDTWYLIQSKYGRAFAGTGTVLTEGQKLIDTLDGQRRTLSSLAAGLADRLSNFRKQASSLDRIVLVLATVDPLTEAEKRALQDVRSIGRDRIGPLFDVDTISVQTIYARLLEEARRTAEQRVSVNVCAVLAESGEGLLVGSIPLLSLYETLRQYRDQTEDLDRLYEKNVRRFLGSRGRVNKSMLATLETTPERFGLYNNGITIVVDRFQRSDDGSLMLVEPYVVNGCQTTRTVWDVCQRRLDVGGHGTNSELEDWKQRAEQGVVVAKIVEVGAAGEDLLLDITRYTNSQNAVKEKDFLGLSTDFRTWSRLMASRFGIFLEIQRGGWDSRKAYQAQHPEAHQYREAANAFDLLKVYGSGWLAEPGTAYGRNAAFFPNGTIFRRIMTPDEDGEPFGVDDLYAAYLLQKAADGYKFGRNAEKDSRRQTRFLFYMVVIELLRHVLIRAEMSVSHHDVSTALTRVLGDQPAASALLDSAVEVIDAYLTRGEEGCVFEEPAYKNAFNGNLNSYLKWERLGKTDEASPRLRDLIAHMRLFMGRSVGGGEAPRDTILAALRSPS